MGEAAVQVGPDISAALLDGQWVAQDEQQLLFLFLLLLHSPCLPAHLSYQVDP